MKLRTVKTKILVPPNDDLLMAIEKAIPKLKEKSIVVITSKVVSIWEGRCVPATKFPDKDKLIKQEADFYLPRTMVPGAWAMHTLKDNVFIPSAGVDESNADGFYILWPKNPKQTAKKLWLWLKQHYSVKELGVIITDSHSMPLRRGVMGISLAHYGFEPLKDYRDELDLFGRPFKMTLTNIADGLAAAAVVMMGEGAERTPVAVVEDIPWVHFTEKPKRSRLPHSSFEIPPKEDLYYPLFSSVPWKKGGKKK